jgi:O-antigen/teichoic acid export membrane protein
MTERHSRSGIRRLTRLLADPLRRGMVTTAVVQGMLVGPSLLLTIAGARLLSINQYALWALCFALGSAVVVVDGGAAALAQIARSEATVSTHDLRRFLLTSAVSPVVVTAFSSALWPQITDVFVSKSIEVGVTLPILIGVGSLLRSWQNVVNGILIAAHRERPRARAAIASGGVQVAGLVLWSRDPTLDGLALVYALGALVGIAAIAPELRHHVGGAHRIGRGQRPRRTIVGILGMAVTQLDRFLVAAVTTPAGLAVYDLVARLAGTLKFACIALATSLVGRARATRPGAGMEELRIGAQRLLDRVAFVAFAALIALAPAVAALTKPELAGEAFVIGLALAVGHGTHASTAVLSAMLSGRGRLGPELGYLCLTVVVIGAMVPLGAAAAGVEGAALGAAVALVTGSLLFRRIGAAVLSDARASSCGGPAIRTTAPPAHELPR